MGIGVIVGVGIIVDIGFGESVGDAIGPEIAPHPIRAAKSNNANNKMPALKKMVFLFIMVSIDGLLYRPTAGGSAAWPRPPCSHHFSRKSKIAFRRSLFEPWPSRLKPRVGQPGFFVFHTDYFNS
jgi:hypothetical protein